MRPKQIRHALDKIAPLGAMLPPTKDEKSALVKAILDQFAPQFAPESILIHARSYARQPARHHEEDFAQFGAGIDISGKMPDVVLHDPKDNRLFLIETSSGNGPVDDKRRGELARLFTSATPGLVFVTAFPNRSIMARYLPSIAWETEIWVADAPSHLIHFNGSRFLGPYSKPA